MVDTREQVYNALCAITQNVYTDRSEVDSPLPIITYAEVTNVHVGLNHDRLEFQVDVWAETMSECLALVQKVDSSLSGMGLRRNYVSPDSVARESKNLYHKAMNYVGHVDLLLNNFFGGK